MNMFLALRPRLPGIEAAPARRRGFDGVRDCCLCLSSLHCFP